MTHRRFTREQCSRGGIHRARKIRAAHRITRSGRSSKAGIPVSSTSRTQTTRSLISPLDPTDLACFRSTAKADLVGRRPSLDNPRDPRTRKVEIQDYRVDIDGLQPTLATQRQQHVRDIERPRPEWGISGRLFQVQRDAPPTRCQCSSCHIPFVLAVGVCTRRSQTRQRVAYLHRYLIAEIDRLGPSMVSIVLDLD